MFEQNVLRFEVAVDNIDLEKIQIKSNDIRCVSVVGGRCQVSATYRVTAAGEKTTFPRGMNVSHESREHCIM